MIKIKHEISFINSTVTIIVMTPAGDPWDVREFSFEAHSEMKKWITTVESTLNLTGEKFTEVVVYTD